MSNTGMGRFQRVCCGCYTTHRPSSAVSKVWDGFQFRDLEGKRIRLLMWLSIRWSLLRKVEGRGVLEVDFVFIAFRSLRCSRSVGVE